MKKICFYRTCPLCGAHLDPSENCTDCKNGEWENEIRALLVQTTNAERLELIRFCKYLLDCQKTGHIVTREEATEMAAAARERIAQAERQTA